ncbi:MAG: hypothetical protein JRI92_12465 [Deltaproteobacteria bacterium]|nr:hypothetical protein [Deltaproteobacteria bacterium]
MENSVFTIIEEKDCPYYQVGDEFKLTGNAILLEYKKSLKCLLSSLHAVS